MSAENKVPAIRFKGFSGEWDESRLGDLCEETYGGGTPRTSISNYWGGDIPWIQSSDLSEGQVVNVAPRKRISEIGLKNSATKLIPEESIAIVTRVGVGKISLMQKGYATSQDFLSLSRLKIAPLYGVYSIWKMLQREKLGVQGTSIKGITKEVLLSKIIEVPNSEIEQTKIGNYFQQLDTLIAQHQQKQDKLLNLKKALLEKMFPKQGATLPEIRFKGFSGEWKEKKLDCEVDLYSGLTYSPSDVTKESGTFVLRSSNVKGGEIVDADNVYVNTEVVNSENVRVGDIIIVVRNGSRSLIGKHAAVKQEMDNTVIGAFMTGMHVGQSDFINALLDTNQFNKEIEKNLGATINQITNGAFRKMKFYFPKPKEQTKIGNLFKQLDTLLQQHQAQLKKLNNIKQACLEKMFV